MKKILIKVINKNPSIKWKVDHDSDELFTVLPKSEWKNQDCAKGKLVVDGSSLPFFMDLKKWKIDDYKRQWKEGLKRLNNHNESCLLMNVYDIKGDPAVSWCLIYKIDNHLFIRLRILIDDYQSIVGNKPFTPDTCYDFIPPRQTHEDDGEKIPEAIIPYEKF